MPSFEDILRPKTTTVLTSTSTSTSTLTSTLTITSTMSISAGELNGSLRADDALYITAFLSTLVLLIVIYCCCQRKARQEFAIGLPLASSSSHSAACIVRAEPTFTTFQPVSSPHRERPKRQSRPKPPLPKRATAMPENGQATKQKLKTIVEEQAFKKLKKQPCMKKSLTFHL